jgi:hypothetical protein
MAPTISDLLTFAAEQARIERIDYFDPRSARADEIRAWRTDCARRSRYRRAVVRDWAGRLYEKSKPLQPGSYYGTRLVITESEIDYTVGQYAPLEIWQAVYDYLSQTD